MYAIIMYDRSIVCAAFASMSLVLEHFKHAHRNITTYYDRHQIGMEYSTEDELDFDLLLFNMCFFCIQNLV